MDAVEEIVDEVFQGETYTGGEAGRDIGDGRCRDVQDGEGDVDEQEPAQQGEDGVGQGQVHVRLFQRQGAVGALIDDATELDHTGKGLDEVDQVPEDEEKADDEDGVFHGQMFPALAVEKRRAQQVRSGQGQLVSPGSEHHAHREGEQDGRGKDDHADQVVQPGDLDEGVLVVERQQRVLLVVAGLASRHPVLVVPLHQVEERDDGVEEGQQEGPYGQGEDADHGVPGQGQDHGRGHDAHGDPHVAEVRPVHVAAIPDVQGRLPDDEDQQDRREDERNHARGQEDGARQDAQEGQQQGGDVDVAGGQGLLAGDADEQRHQDRERQPGKLGEQGEGHPPVRIATVRLDEQHADGEQEDSQDA